MTEDDEKISMEEKEALEVEEALEEGAALENTERDFSSSKIKRPDGKQRFKQVDGEVIDTWSEDQDEEDYYYNELESASCPDCGKSLEFTREFQTYLNTKELGSVSLPITLPTMFRCTRCSYVGDDVMCNSCNGGGYFLLEGKKEYSKGDAECVVCDGEGVALGQMF